jgi:hypothetical protein
LIAARALAKSTSDSAAAIFSAFSRFILGNLVTKQLTIFGICLVVTYRHFHHTRFSIPSSCQVLKPEDGGREAPSRPIGLPG